VRRALPVALGAAAVGAVLYARRDSGAPTPQWAGRLATWVPPRPATPRARLLTTVWAAPMSLAGLLIGAAAGVRPRLLPEGVVLFAPAAGLTGRIIRARGFSAAAFGHVIVSVTEPAPALLAHELVHVRQAERLGAFMAPVYLGLLARFGYRDHPLEMAARLGAAHRGAREA